MKHGRSFLHHTMRYLLSFIFFLIFASFPDVRAENIPSKHTVTMGVLPLSLHTFDYFKNSFKTSFYVWWLYDDAAYKPQNSVEITNSYEFNVKFGGTDKVDGKIRTQARYFATVQQHWNITNFPFDLQTIVIPIEDSEQEIANLKFSPDRINSTLPRDFTIPGWEILNFHVEEAPFHYNTNFGDPSVKETTYSRLAIVFDIKRLGLRLFFNYFIGFFVAFVVCLLTFFVDRHNLNAKYSLCMAAVFASVGNKYVLDSFLPFTTTFTLSDAIQVATFTYIITAAITATFQSLPPRSEENEIRLKKTARITFFGFTMIWIAFVGHFLLRAIFS